MAEEENKQNKEREAQEEKLKKLRHESEIVKFQLNLLKEILKRGSNIELLLILFLSLTSLDLIEHSKNRTINTPKPNTSSKLQ